MRKSTRAYFDDIYGKAKADEADGLPGYVTWDDMQDEIFGPVGTPERDRWERNSERRRTAHDLAWRVTRPYGVWGTFWRSFVFENPGSLHAAADALSFEYLGDFMFHMDPVTEDYYQSWVSKVHLPRWLHYHVGPRRDCTHV